MILESGASENQCAENLDQSYTEKSGAILFVPCIAFPFEQIAGNKYEAKAPKTAEVLWLMICVSDGPWKWLKDLPKTSKTKSIFNKNSLKLQSSLCGKRDNLSDRKLGCFWVGQTSRQVRDKRNATLRRESLGWAFFVCPVSGFFGYQAVST